MDTGGLLDIEPLELKFPCKFCSPPCSGSSPGLLGFARLDRFGSDDCFLSAWRSILISRAEEADLEFSPVVE